MPAGTTREAGTIAGAESIDLQEGNSHGVLLLHGFGDTPQTLQLLARELSAAGYDVRAPLLPGHGRSVQAFMASRREQWIACARDELSAMQASYETVAVAGLSMGGALAAILAAEHPEIPAIILLAPYFDMPVSHRIASASHWLWGRAAGPRPSRNPGSILDPSERARSLAYGVYTGRLLYELWRLAGRARASLSSIRSPTLLVQSRGDPRIAPIIAERAFAAIKTPEKKLVWIEGAGHVITVDYGRARVFTEVKTWLQKYSPASR